MEAKKKGLNAVKIVSFLCLLVLTVHLLDRTMIAKYMDDEKEPQTKTYKGFYHMEKDSVDVLILGTSHAAAAINPQDMYDTAGIRAYNLASSAQPVWASYYWLKEALKYQSPSAIVFDVNYLFRDSHYETCNRKALDDMRLGSVKYAAVRTAVATDQSGKETALSYIFPFFRYHSRWSSNLNEWDFDNSRTEVPPKLKGFWYYTGLAHYEDFTPLDVSTSSEEAPFVETSFSWFEKMVDLCQKNHIMVIMIKTPTHRFTVEKHNAVQAYADEKGFPFYDYNEAELYHASGLDYSHDMDDASLKNAHLNPSGARKISKDLAVRIAENGWANSCQDDQWELTKETNENLYKDFMLQHTEDIATYFDMLKDDRYTVFISAKDDASAGMNDMVKTALSDLGLTVDWSDMYRHGYLAEIDRENVVYEKVNNKRIEYSGSFRDGVMRITMSSAGYESGNQSSICINGVEQSRNSRGLNIVVYNNERHCVIDSVCFDTCATDMKCVR